MEPRLLPWTLKLFMGRLAGVLVPSYEAAPPPFRLSTWEEASFNVGKFCFCLTWGDFNDSVNILNSENFVNCVLVSL